MVQQISSIGLLVGIMLFISALETFLPIFKNQNLRRMHSAANVGLMIITFSLNISLNVSAVILISSFNLTAHAPFALELPLWLAVIIGVSMLDFFTYLAHRSMHAFPILWKVHRVHHSDPLVDVTTAYRQHPIEGLWRFMFIIIPAWALGVPAVALVIYRGISAMFALFEHMNIKLWMPADTVLSWLFITPNIHKIHHSQDQVETDTNYGNILSIYDHMLKTFTPQKEPRNLAYGLKEIEPARAVKLTDLLRLPFKPKTQPETTKTHQRHRNQSRGR